MRTFARLLVVCSGLLGCVVSAWSQTNTDTYFFTPGGGGVNGAMAMCLNGTNPATARAVPCSDPSALPSPVSGTFSASLAGFTPNGNFGTLTATAASSGSTALPGGAVVAFQNTSTIDLSCVLSAGAATATTNKIVIRGGSSVFLTVGSNINAACINQTGSASNVVVMAGGTGLGTNFGGGGSGGGGGAVTMASGAVASGAFSAGAAVDGADLTQGALADAAVTAGATGTVSAKLRAISRDIGTLTTLFNANGRAASANSSPVVPSAAPSTWHLIAASGTNATSVKNSAATLFSCQLSGVGSTPAFLKIYNKATAPTVGSDTPVKTLIIPAASTAANGAGSNITFGPGGLVLGTGFAAAITGVMTDADATSVAASTFAINCDYE